MLLIAFYIFFGNWLISRQSTPNNSGKDKADNYDSTASTPIADREKVIKKFAQTEKKASKSKFKLTMDYQTNSAPPILNQRKWKVLLDDLQYNKIKKNFSANQKKMTITTFTWTTNLGLLSDTTAWLLVSIFLK